MLQTIVLAAGKGTRMRSDKPKVLQSIAGKPMLCHVLDNLAELGGPQHSPLVVVGHGKDQVRDSLSDRPVTFVEQNEQLGTGHAVMQTLEQLPDEGTAIILYGDVPLTRAATLQQLADLAGDQCLALLTITLDNPAGYGRIMRDAGGAVEAIVEEKDATAEQRREREINTGMMAAPTRLLKHWLPRLSNDNAQGEYYLTDIVAMARADNISIEACQPQYNWEVEGVNNRAQQAQLERRYQLHIAQSLMADGLSLADPARFDCRGKLTIGRDVFIDINAVLEGNIVLEDGVHIGPNCVIKNAHIGSHTLVEANSMIDGARVASGCTIGPFARLRPGSELHPGAKVGNFVEVKKSVIGAGSKVNHLSYIGDCQMGSGVNVGAGTITCNYDGVNKFRTSIGDDCFIGSNTALVAPVALAQGTTVAAGSVITRDTEDEDLAVARGKQRNIKGWQRPQ